jgi:hypothetical protein
MPHLRAFYSGPPLGKISKWLAQSILRVAETSPGWLGSRKIANRVNRDKRSKKVERMGLISIFVIGEVGRRRRSADRPWLRRHHFWVDASAMKMDDRLKSFLALKLKAVIGGRCVE